MISPSLRSHQGERARAIGLSYGIALLTAVGSLGLARLLGADERGRLFGAHQLFIALGALANFGAGPASSVLSARSPDLAAPLVRVSVSRTVKRLALLTVPFYAYAALAQGIDPWLAAAVLGQIAVSAVLLQNTGALRSSGRTSEWQLLTNAGGLSSAVAAGILLVAPGWRTAGTTAVLQLVAVGMTGLAATGRPPLSYLKKRDPSVTLDVDESEYISLERQVGVGDVPKMIALRAVPLSLVALATPGEVGRFAAAAALGAAVRPIGTALSATALPQVASADNPLATAMRLRWGVVALCSGSSFGAIAAMSVTPLIRLLGPEYAGLRWTVATLMVAAGFQAASASFSSILRGLSETKADALAEWSVLPLLGLAMASLPPNTHMRASLLVMFANGSSAAIRFWAIGRNREVTRVD